MRFFFLLSKLGLQNNQDSVKEELREADIILVTNIDQQKMKDVKQEDWQKVP